MNNNAALWQTQAKEFLSAVFLYVLIALAVLLVAVGVFVRFKRRDALKSYARTALALSLGFALCVTVTMLTLEFLNMREKGTVFGLILYPTAVLAAALLAGAAAVYVASFFGKKPLKITAISALSLSGAALVALFVCFCVYYASGDAEANNGAEITLSENVALYLSAFGVLAVIVAGGLLFGRKDKKGFDSKTISYAAVCIALSFALSFLSPVRMMQGGSVTIASLLPFMLYSYMFGTKKGVFAGFVYGLLQAVQDPWIIHPAQFLLDYPVAFSAIGLAGAFAKNERFKKLPQLQFALGAILASVLRYAAHVLSGVFAFSEYALDALGNPMNVWLYSLGYNAFVFADIAVAIAAGVVILCSPSFVKQLRRFNVKKEPPNKSEPSEPKTEEP